MKDKSVIYVERDFYGPLELLPEMTQRASSDTEFYRHPRDATKLIRHLYGSFVDKSDMSRAIADTHELLGIIKGRGIAHVNPEYFDATAHDGDGEPTLGAVVDMLPEHITYRQILDDSTQLSDGQLLNEVDGTIVTICDYVSEAGQVGGVVGIDVLLPHQFVYVPSYQPGQRFVLTDIEPIGLERLQPDSQSPGLVALYAELLNDITKLQASLLEAGSRFELSCVAATRQMIDQVPDSMPQADELRAAMTEALDGGSSERLDRYIVAEIDGEFWDED